MTGSTVMFVGGPGSGKSNYLFRVWMAIEHQSGRLRKNGLPTELDYLHDGASELLSGRFAPHTSLNVATTCEIPVSILGSNTTSTLTVPDVSGEVWNGVCDRREWPVSWDSFLASECGFVLFVRAGSPHNVKPLDWVTCERLYKDRTAARAETRVPTQVYLVEWMRTLRQLVTERSGSSYRPRLSVVVTAWDGVQLDPGPHEYIAREFPLFDQYLRADLHGFDARLFGVSVVGGDLGDEGYRDEYLAQDPVTRGYCVVAIGRHAETEPDLLTPLYWSLGR